MRQWGSGWTIGGDWGRPSPLREKDTAACARSALAEVGAGGLGVAVERDVGFWFCGFGTARFESRIMKLFYFFLKYPSLF